MARKQTLEQKKEISDAVTGETKRCIAIINRHLGEDRELRKLLIRDMVEQQPYVDFHDYLYKKIPQ